MADYKNVDTSKYGSNYDESSFWSKIAKFAGKAGKAVIFNALKLYYAMKMGKLNAAQIAIVVGALGYFISPVDLISDLIPVVGFTDDAGVLAAAVASISACSDSEVVKAAQDKLDEWF